MAWGAFVALGDGVADLLVFVQGAVATGLDLRVVDEDVGAAAIGGDEAEALLGVLLVNLSEHCGWRRVRVMSTCWGRMPARRCPCRHHRRHLRAGSPGCRCGCSPRSQGPAIGGDAELAYACDFRIANTKARFGNLEAQLGILAAAGPLLSPAGTGWEPRVKEILSSSAEGCATTNIVAAAFPRRALSRSESFLAGGASTSE